MSENHNNNWYSEWFNTPYYHLLYKDRDESEAAQFIKALLSFLNPSENARILDLACGKGRHSKKVNELGFNVTGIDLSKNSIEIANKCANQNLHFAVHDMREPFKANAYDIVLNLFTSFGYFNDDTDNQKVLNAVAQNLKPKGTFVLDFLNSCLVVKELIPYEEKSIEGINFKISKTFDNHVIVKRIEFSDKGKDYQFEERVTAFSFNDLEELFSTSNLKIKHVFGDYNLQPFNEETSDRLIIVAENGG